MQKLNSLNVFGIKLLSSMLILTTAILMLTGAVTLASGAALDGDHFQDASGGNTTVVNQVVRKGWGFMPGNGKFAIEDIPIDYGLDFDELPFLVVKFANSKQVADGDPADLADCSITRNVIATGVNQTTSGFKPILRTPTGLGFPSATNYCYSWIAIGRHDASYNGETDPKVGSLSLNSIPKWDGSTLTDSISIFEDTSGKVGFGTVSPTAQLHVEGDAFISGDLTLDGELNGIVDADLLEGFNASEIVEAAVDGYLPTGSDIPILSIEAGGVGLNGNYTLDGKTFRVAIEVTESNDAGILRKYPVREFYDDIKLSHVKNEGTPSDFAVWYSGIKAGTPNPKNVTILLYDSVQFAFYNAWPSAIQQINLGSGQILETVTLTSEQIDLLSAGNAYFDTEWLVEVDSGGYIYTSGVSPADSESEIIETLMGGETIHRKSPGVFRAGYLDLFEVSPEDIYNNAWSEQKSIIDSGGTVTRRTVSVNPVSGGIVRNYFNCWPSEIKELSHGKGTQGQDMIIFEKLTYACDDVANL